MKANVLESYVHPWDVYRRVGTSAFVWMIDRYTFPSLYELSEDEDARLLESEVCDGAWVRWGLPVIEKYLSQVIRRPNVVIFTSSDSPSISKILKEAKWDAVYHDFDSTLVELFFIDESTRNNVLLGLNYREESYPGHLLSQGSFEVNLEPASA